MVTIYHIKTLKDVNKFTFLDKVVFYHKQLSIAITNKLDYYKINNKCELQKVVIGKYYVANCINN